MPDIPKLLKARQYHSRIFAVVAVALILVSHPWVQDITVRQGMVWMGYVLVIIGAFGRVYCSAFIGGRKNDEVVRAGPFSIVRNPLYVFSFLATVGIGLQSGMFAWLVLISGAYITYYPLVVEKEEAFLKHRFGEAYEAYLREVPRWFPNFKLWHEPEQVDAKPKFIRRTMMDASVFFLAWPCFYLISLLQTAHILPVWLILP